MMTKLDLTPRNNHPKTKFSFSTTAKVGAGNSFLSLKSIFVWSLLFWVIAITYSLKSVQKIVSGLLEASELNRRLGNGNARQSPLHEIPESSSEQISFLQSTKIDLQTTTSQSSKESQPRGRTSTIKVSVKHHLDQSTNSTIVHVINSKAGVHTVEVEGITPRNFDPWPANKSLPCFEAEENWVSMDIQRKPSQVGFLYLKPYKTGSSTGSGINLRISRNVAKQFGYNMCKLRFEHGPDGTPGITLFRNRSHEDSFLWTVLREPTARSISAFFHFGVSRLRIEPTNENFLGYINNITQDYYLDALYTEKRFLGRHVDNPIEVCNSILKEFNFIGITERMDESAVALMMLLNLNLNDILYLSAKVKGGYDDGGGKYGCTIIQPSFVTPEMEKYFASKKWKNRMKYEVALYDAANKSLDMTIDALGRIKFEENLAAFRNVAKIASDTCAEVTKFPCDEWGRKRDKKETDCLWNDSGCGTTCLDQVAAELKLR